MTGGTLADALGHSLLAGGLGTAVGTLPVLFVRTIGPRAESALAGFSAGVMLAAAFVGLLLPALELAQRATPATSLATWPVLLRVALGALAIDLLHRAAPHGQVHIVERLYARKRFGDALHDQHILLVHAASAFCCAFLNP